MKSIGFMHPKGFTLLEILIAVFILGVILSTIYTSYARTFRNIEETESRAEIYRMARIALERMVEDLESVYISQWPKDLESEEEIQGTTRFVGEDAEINGRSADTLRFLSKAHLVFKEGDEGVGTAEIIYNVRESEGEDGFFLYRVDTPELEERPKEGTGGVLLCDGLYSVNFKYYDENGEVYDSWDSTSESSKNSLPVRVFILLEFVNRSAPEAPFKFTAGVALPLAKNTYEKVS